MNVFATSVNGFDPVAKPVLAFGMDDGTDALIRAFNPGDLALYVGTRSPPTAEAERGRLLGLAEFGGNVAETTVSQDQNGPSPNGSVADGKPARRTGVRILRAWLFPEPRLKALDVLVTRLPNEADQHAVLLGDADARVVLALTRTEVTLPTAYAAERQGGFDTFKGEGPTTGPMPVDWTGLVERGSQGRSWTYAMRYGRRDVWKVGHTRDLDERLADVNRHVPFEEIGERWAILLRQPWPDSPQAYAMEQRVFALMKAQRSIGERVRCAETVLRSAWARSLTDV